MITGKDVFLITTRRDRGVPGSYPIELERHFDHIVTLLQRKFSGNSLLCEDFHPDTESEQVLYELNKYRHAPEYAYYNYEFPHNEVREQMKMALRRKYLV